MKSYVMSDEIGIAGAIDPQLGDNTALTTDWIDFGVWQRVMFVFLLGATDITVDVKLQSADDTSGTNAADISGKAITQLGATDDNKQAILNLSKDELNDGDVAAAAVVTIGDGTTGANVAVAAIGIPHYGPPEHIDLATVAEIVE